MRLEKEIKHSGKFWLPESPEKSLPGTLIISDGGDIQLEINSDDELSDDDLHIERITGNVEKLGYVILDNCMYKRKSLAFGLGITTSSLLVRRAFIGVSNDCNDAIKLSRFTFEIEGLNEWLRITGIKVSHDYENHNAVITYEPQPPIEITIDGATIRIAYAYSIPGTPTLTEAKITHRAELDIIADEPRELDYFSALARKITSFLCIAIDKTVAIFNVNATIPSSETEDNRDIKVKIFYPSLPYSDSKPTDFNRHESLFTYPIIREQFPEVLRRWIDNYDTIYPALHLFLATKDGTHKYLENKFLAMAQSLETFSRRTSLEKMFSDSDYKDLQEHLLNSCPKPHLDWLKGKLLHGNEISLAKRLTTLFSPFKHELDQTEPKTKAAIRKIVDSRNYLTHYDPASKSKCAWGREMWILNQKMEAVMILSILKHSGLNSAALAKISQGWAMTTRFNCR